MPHARHISYTFIRSHHKALYYVLRLRPKFQPQHPLLEHPQLIQYTFLNMVANVSLSCKAKDKIILLCILVFGRQGILGRIATEIP